MFSMSAGEVTRNYIPEHIAKNLAGILFVIIGLDTLRQTPTGQSFTRAQPQEKYEEFTVSISEVRNNRSSSPSPDDYAEASISPSTPLYYLGKNHENRDVDDGGGGDDDDDSNAKSKDWFSRSLSETLSIAAGLTFSNLAGGVGAGLADLDISLVTILAFLANFILLDVGERIGVSISGSLPTTPILVGSGSILVIMGLMQFVWGGDSP
eukprot:CAMPEP_0184480850 /NCGR_PEP_ID=MMETSP0113_2-20130426/2354_1 /TAXON_ID=91329 /ORGANISM="Norrisiella sphaerica, Strain BC52" /LENGTH=208 /DNA_ID=CAMNT_0026859599 /DNA_START=129 /DNA_END=755 /DNA_ORIENTATION=-